MDFSKLRLLTFKWSILSTQKVLFIGGPGTGKTSVINFLKDKGYPCFSEISRQVTLEAQKQGISQLFLEQPLLFSKKLLEGRINQFQSACKLPGELCFIDRGIPDVGAYMNYKSEAIPEYFTQADQDHHYDKVFLFPIWKDIYVSDNERYESFEEAQGLQAALKKAYKNLGYTLIEIPKTTVANRVEFILKTLNHVESQ